MDTFLNLPVVAQLDRFFDKLDFKLEMLDHNTQHFWRVISVIIGLILTVVLAVEAISSFQVAQFYGFNLETEYIAGWLGQVVIFAFITFQTLAAIIISLLSYRWLATLLIGFFCGVAALLIGVLIYLFVDDATLMIMVMVILFTTGSVLLVGWMIRELLKWMRGGNTVYVAIPQFVQLSAVEYAETRRRRNMLLDSNPMIGVKIGRLVVVRMRFTDWVYITVNRKYNR